jgi:hypothetical protein
LKFLHERNALRGKKIKDATAAGGEATAAARKLYSQRTLAEMCRLIVSGQSITNAARLAHKAGFGSSASANEKLWHRHKPN